MGTYFALMDEAAKHGGDYQDLDHFRETLLKVQNGQASPDKVSELLATLNAWVARVTALQRDQPSVADQAQKALDRLANLRSAVTASSSVARR